MVMVFASCTNQSTSTQDESATTKKLSPLASDPTFKESIHVVRNDTTNVSSVIKGDGTILLNAMRPYIDSVGVVNDAKTGEVTYIYKQVYGETMGKNSYTDAYSGETYTYSEANNYLTFYDRDGKEIGLTADTYGARMAIGDKIFYEDSTKGYENNLYVYDVKTKKSEKTMKDYITYYGSHLMFSTDPYGIEDEKKEILICDDDFKVIRTIENYSVLNTQKAGNAEVCIVRTNEIINSGKLAKDMIYNVDYRYKYNFLDNNLNFIFSEDVDNEFYIDSSPIVTFHRGDIEFDYDFEKMKVVGEERPYKGYENNNDLYWIKRAPYSLINDAIKELDSKYSYVETKIHDDKVLFFAHYQDDNINYDDPVYTYKDHADLYSLDMELIGSYDNLNSVYEDEGYFQVDHDTIYDFDLNIIKVFNEKVNVSRSSLGDFVYFTDSNDARYNTRPKYNIYDKDFNVLFENVVYDSSYGFDDRYFTYAAEGHTRIVDTNLKVIKEYDKEMSVWSWYENRKYKVFTDIKTKRMGILDENLNIIIEGLKSINGLEDECFSYNNGFRYGLMDYNGLEICSFSMFNTMNEDARSGDEKIRMIE